MKAKEDELIEKSEQIITLEKVNGDLKVEIKASQKCLENIRKKMLN
jgi:hypothetical protein